MAGELSGILEHVDRIGELDLEGVEPTSHVVELENVLRADEPRPSWPREWRWSRRPIRSTGRSAFPRRRPTPDGELLELTVAEAAARIAAGELSAAEYFDAWREAAAGDELNAYLWRAEDGEPARAARARWPGIPVAVKDIFCTEGVPTTAGSRILEGYGRPTPRPRCGRLDEAGARVLGKTNMDEFAMGSSNENSAYGPVLNPWDRGASRAAPRAARRRRSPAASRPGRSAPTPAARSASRRRSAGSSG